MDYTILRLVIDRRMRAVRRVCVTSDVTQALSAEELLGQVAVRVVIHGLVARVLYDWVVHSQLSRRRVMGSSYQTAQLPPPGSRVPPDVP